MTLRRLGVLIRGLPADAALWAAVEQSRTKAEQDRKISKLEDRQKRYQRKGGAA
jgi:hypothetical protein